VRVLLRVEHLEQRARRIAVEAALAELVDLVEHEHRVLRLRAAQRLDDVAGQRADVGAPVAADLRLVVHAPERDPLELAARGARDRLAERGLADARRPDEAQDRALAARVELPDGEMLEDAPLDLIEAVMVLVEDLPRLGDVDRLARFVLPGQLGEPFQVGAQHAALGAALAHALQPLELLGGVLVHVLGHARLVDGLLQLLQLGVRILVLAQLLLDLPHLLTQHVLALTGVELLLRLLADLLRDAQDADALREPLEHLVEARLQIESLEELLLVLVLHVEQIRHHVGEQRRGAHVLDHDAELLGRVRQQLDRLDGLALQLEEARLDLGGQFAFNELFALLHVLHARDEEWPAAQELEHAKAVLALHHHVMHAFAAGDVAHHLASGADPIEVVGLDVVFLRVALQQEADLLLGAHRLLCRSDRRRTADRHGRDDAREEHRVAHRDEDQRVLGQRLRRALPCALGGGRRGGIRSSFCEHFGVHAPSFLRKTSVSTPSASCLSTSSSGAYGSASGKPICRSKRPYGISRRCTFIVSSRQGNGRSAETVSPAASSATVMAFAGTPGSAICTRRPSGDSAISTGGSHATVACWKNWRCRRSARSIIESASPHIHVEKSREVIGPYIASKSGESRAARFAPLFPSNTRASPSVDRAQLRLRGGGSRGLFEKPLPERGHRRPLGDDLRADEVVGRLGLELHLERRAQAAGGDVGVDERP
jgi:hypothetical protein